MGGASSASSRPTSALGGGALSSAGGDLLPARSPRSPGVRRSALDDAATAAAAGGGGASSGAAAASAALEKDDAEGEDAMQDGELNALAADQTTLLPNDEEGFALAPVDTTTVKVTTLSFSRRSLSIWNRLGSPLNESALVRVHFLRHD